MMQVAKEVVRFLRWRLVPVRYFGKWWRVFIRTDDRAPRLASVETVEREGYMQGPRIDSKTLDEIRSKYKSRCATVAPTRGGHPFINLLTAEDFSTTDPVVRLAFSHSVLDIANDYFEGRLTLDSIQVLYSWPTSEMCESQKWHKDYGDSRSFHWIAYLEDVVADDDGPFVFVDRSDSRRIRRSPWIRRIDDNRFLRELGVGKLRRFLGRAGDSIYVDPSACYHYGSRCRNPRLAIFITFNTDRPFVSAADPIRANSQKLLEVGRALRPDLSDAYFRRLLVV